MRPGVRVRACTRKEELRYRGPGQVRSAARLEAGRSHTRTAESSTSFRLWMGTFKDRTTPNVSSGNDVAAKLWSLCHTLRHDGIDYGDYVEQLTALLFIKMADERDVPLPALASWSGLRRLSGPHLITAYADAVQHLAVRNDRLGEIFRGAQSRFANPESLGALIELVDELNWSSLDLDVKGAAFEGLLEKAAAEGKKGAGQYFTPRVLVDAIVSCVKPDPTRTSDFRVIDPACGTGGFLIAAHEWFDRLPTRIDERTLERVRTKTYYGKELTDRPRRLAMMNLYLHGLEPQVALGDSLYEPPGALRYDLVLTNPPFGTRGGRRFPDRSDFEVQTTNKQLNFIQHAITLLKDGGTAAIVVPDNVLFAAQAADVLKNLTARCDLHTVLRCPLGTFAPYTEGTRTNVLFFTRGPKTSTTWIFDARSNIDSITKKSRPLLSSHFREFEACYGDDPRGRSARSQTQSSRGRWRAFSISEIAAADYKLDHFRWIDEDAFASTGTAVPQDLLAQAVEELQMAIEHLGEMREYAGLTGAGS